MQVFLQIDENDRAQDILISILIGSRLKMRQVNDRAIIAGVLGHVTLIPTKKRVTGSRNCARVNVGQDAQ